MQVAISNGSIRGQILTKGACPTKRCRGTVRTVVQARGMLLTAWTAPRLSRVGCLFRLSVVIGSLGKVSRYDDFICPQSVFAGKYHREAALKWKPEAGVALETAEVLRHGRPSPRGLEGGGHITVCPASSPTGEGEAGHYILV